MDLTEHIEAQTYDRSISKYDEPHPPNVLQRLVTQKNINKGKFLSEAHAGSYLCQMQTIHGLGDVKSCFEVGPGEGFVARNLEFLGYEYHTLDFEPAHNPTIVGDFSTFDPLPLRKKYDLSCAFQVLEHFPFSDFSHLMEKLIALSKKYVFISLPYSCQGVRAELRAHNGQHSDTHEKTERFFPTNLPNRVYREAYIKEFPWAVHHWEIGRKGYPLETVLEEMAQCGLNVTNQFHGPNPFHYFLLSEISE